MNQLLKFKDLILQFVGRYEIYVMAAFRFAVGYVAFRLIIQNTGYMPILSDYPFAILLALLCCFLPAGLMVFVGAVLILLEIYALAPILCLIVGIIFLIMFCLYLRFTSRKGMYLVLAPVLSVLGVPYTLPVASGLLGEPYAVISVICGEAVYFIMRHVADMAVLFLAAEETDSTSDQITMAVTELIMDQEMYLYMIGFAVAAIVTYCFCRLHVNFSHLLAAAIGILIQIAVIGGGEIMLGNESEFTRILLGCAVSFLILLIISFFTHNLDYSRVENVQFEDDDYYYYVKAIPKKYATRKGKTEESEPQGVQITAEQLAEAIEKNAAEESAAAKETNGSQTEGKRAASQQLASDAAQKAAEAEAAERAAAEAVAERAAAATQAISAAAGQGETTEDKEVRP